MLCFICPVGILAYLSLMIMHGITSVGTATLAHEHASSRFVCRSVSGLWYSDFLRNTAKLLYCKAAGDPLASCRLWYKKASKRTKCLLKCKCITQLYIPNNDESPKNINKGSLPAPFPELQKIFH